jgi:phage portal protein BeeE
MRTCQVPTQRSAAGCAPVRLFGWTIARERAEQRALQPVDHRGGWFGLVRESFAGAWQRNIDIRVENVLTYTAVFSCISLIANDIAKLRLRLVRQDDDGIWVETESSAFSPVLRRPNRYQNRIQFIANWVTSKLVHGNTYVLKQRDQRGIVTALYILDPAECGRSWRTMVPSTTSFRVIT